MGQMVPKVPVHLDLLEGPVVQLIQYHLWSQPDRQALSSQQAQHHLVVLQLLLILYHPLNPQGLEPPHLPVDQSAPVVLVIHYVLWHRLSQELPAHLDFLHLPVVRLVQPVLFHLYFPHLQWALLVPLDL